MLHAILPTMVIENKRTADKMEGGGGGRGKGGGRFVEQACF